MRDEILSHAEMCLRERISLQRGMNFREPPAISVLLMSRRPAAPYQDELSSDGSELIDEGHDVARRAGLDVDVKSVDQPWKLPSGRPTDNAKFAAICGQSPSARVRVYEKLRDGIWSDRGLFELERFEFVPSGVRRVFKFHLLVTTDDDSGSALAPIPKGPTRQIPSWVKQEVYKRDAGRCVICGRVDELHFDHDLPYSLGGTGIKPENVRILCARHNLSKGKRIE